MSELEKALEFLKNRKFASIPQPEAPAIEYCISIGEGTLVNYGVTEKEIQAEVELVEEGQNLKFWAAPCTTSCMTGK